jgi:hypothetical protein
MGQATVATGGVVPIFTIPASLCNVTFWNSGAGTAYIGSSTTVTSANGLTCHSIPTSFSTYVGSKGGTFYGTCATTAVINYILSTDF